MNSLKTRLVLGTLLCAVCLVSIVGLYMLHSMRVARIARLTSLSAPSTPKGVGPAPLTTIDEGIHYLRFPAKITASKTVEAFVAQNPGKIQVIEFFNYGCFWCSRLQPFTNAWLKTKPDEIAFYRIPVIFNKNWDVLAKAYYIVKQLGKNDLLDSVFFEAINQKHIDLSNEKLLKDFFAQLGIPEKQFLELYHSFTISREISKAEEISNAYEIVLSPVVVINGPSGSYLLNAAMVGSEENLITVLNYLLKQESKQSKQ